MALTTITGNMVSVNAIQGTLIADNAITAVHIATNAVSGTLIADNAVTAVHIAQNSITVTQLADDCVESDKIADGIITTNHLNKAMISSQTEVTAATGDFVLLGDTSDSNNLKKTPVSSLAALAAVADGAITSAKLDTNIAVTGTLNVGGAFTSLGIDDNADATALTIDSSERIGIPAIGQVNVLGTVIPYLSVNGINAQNAHVNIHRHRANSLGGYLSLSKSRSDTKDFTIVQDADELGTISFQGADGSQFQQAAQIQAEVDGTPGSSDMPGRIVFLTTADGAVTPTERMRIASSGDVTMSGTGALKIPVGTTAQRPTGANGMMRYNTTNSKVEIYDGSWSSLAVDVITATGGTITTSGGYKYHTFTSSGTFQITAGSGTVEYLIIAGGGGGGNNHGGGGGAGGLVAGSGTFSSSSNTITVGAGGGGYTNGSNSTALGATTAIGGGKGGGQSTAGSSGGSGGGAGGHQPTQSTGYAGTSGQGNAGGNQWGSDLNGGGGGGAGAVGGNGVSGSGGVGGAGTNSYSAWATATSTGVSGYYAGGGGGGAWTDQSQSLGAGGAGGGGAGGNNAGTANTGSGGGGGDNGGGSGGAGGSGIVILRYVV